MFPRPPILIALLLVVPVGLAVSTDNVTSPVRTLLPAHALACGAETLDVSGFDLVGVHEKGVRHPDVPADQKVLTFTIEQWKCIYPTESSSTGTDGIGPLVGPGHEEPAYHGTHPVSGELGAMWNEGTPKAGAYSGYMKIVIILPDPSDALYPPNGCNWDDVGQAMIWLNQNVGGGSYERWCYYAPSPGWNSGGDTNTNNNMNRLHSYVHNSQSHWVNDPNEFVLGVLEEMANNGAAWEGSKIGILAEAPTSGVNLWDDGIALHEVSHGFGGVHYPIGGNPNFCGSQVSVMNYCDIALHNHVYDTTNDNTIQTRYWTW